MTAPSVSLLPCPFCGEERIYLNEPDPSINFKGSINCPACLAAIPHEVNREEMIECWNTRATPPAPTPSAARERIARLWHKARNDWMRASRHGTQEEADSAAIAILATALLPDAAAIRAAAFEEAAGIAENHSFGRDIDWWLNATKKHVSAESCRSVAAAIRAAGEEVMKPCATCGGTGWQLLDRSWLKTDGYRRGRCGICSGTGLSNYRDDPKFVREQAKRRTAGENAK